MQVLDRLDFQQREGVIKRLREESKDNAGFYLLIILSAIVTTFGLLLDSGAVIIGGMIIAPLLYPILAVGGGIVTGHRLLIKRAIFVSTKGILLAVLVSLLITLVSPLNEPTREMLVRTRPTLIDLIIALASGAAGAYAVAVRERLVALTGVVVAAALVPPISIAGFGLATMRYDLVSGAVLLFLANLIAVVVATAVVFYLLGFSPGRTNEKKTEAKRDFALSIVLFLSVFGLLTVFLVTSINDAGRSKAIEEEVRLFLKNYDSSTVVSIQEYPAVNSDVITLTIRSPSMFTQRAVNLLDRRIEDRLGEEVDLQIILIPATKLVDEN